ncbi:MAG: hypothetical protein Q4F39_01270 [Bacteroidia bacterium]|nr:hypothetical protein [Bacteroidia bacterium]
MKKYLLFVTTLLVAGCGINPDEHNRVVAQRDSLETVVSQLKVKIDELENGEQRMAGKIETLISDQNYIEALKQIDVLKEKHPGSPSVVNFNSRIASLKQKADAQQAAIDKHVRDSIRMANLNNLGIWKINYFVDKFNEPTKEGYITSTKPIYGTFSNTATQDSDLRVEFIIASKKSVAFQLYEYNRNNPVKGYDDEYNVYVQDKNGKRYELRAHNYSSDRLTMSTYNTLGGKTHAAVLHDILMQGGNIKFRVVDRDRSSTQYNFEIKNADWYDNAYYKLTGTYPND